MPVETQGGETPNETVVPDASAVAGMPTPDAVEAGTPTPDAQPAEIDWANFDVSLIPEDVIKGSALYKQVLKESIERRQELTALKKTQPQVTPPPDDAPAWAKQIITRLDAIDASSASARRQQAIKDSGVDIDVSRLAALSDDDFNALLDDLGKIQKKSGGVSGRTSSGNAAGDGDALGALRNRIKGKMVDKGVDSPSPFDPGVQRTRGGGAVR